jgi:hypothetical protein
LNGSQIVMLLRTCGMPVGLYYQRVAPTTRLSVVEKFLLEGRSPIGIGMSGQRDRGSDVSR